MAVASPPTRELLIWIDARPRTYREAIEAWHSHCPRLTVWEDALIDGLLAVERTAEGSQVRVTERGRTVLESS
ncbi:MAG TPA: hypothetical protein VLK36_10035 [Gaiellaceae bacterium]|nr:hypothetical protein [Gaiellaceae bacterium]